MPSARIVMNHAEIVAACGEYLRAHGLTDFNEGGIEIETASEEFQGQRKVTRYKAMVDVRIKASAHVERGDELAELQKHVASRVLADIMGRNIRVEYNHEDKVYNLFDRGQWHSWHSKPEEVDAAVVRLLQLSEPERKAVADEMFRNALEMPIVVDRRNAVDVPASGTGGIAPRQG